MKLKALKQFFHDHLKIILLCVKVFFILIILLYFLSALILAILGKKDKDNEKVKKWKKGISMFNQVLVYIIIISVTVFFVFFTKGPYPLFLYSFSI